MLMPILPAEPTAFPEGLLEGTTAPESADRLWWVLHTRARQEKALARQLREYCAPYFLPLTRRRLAVRGRIFNSFVPLFTGYVFLLADDGERLAALGTGRVAQSLPVPDQGRLWEQLRQIHRLLSAGRSVVSVERLTPGAVVEIRSGPLAGLRGKVLQTSSERRFVVQVDFIQRGAAVVLEGCDLVRVAPEDVPA
jgi:transcriptional antiterminator RfaH